MIMRPLVNLSTPIAYRPSTNGQTERKNRSIKAELRKRCHQFGPDWPSMLKWIEFSYNTTVHKSGVLPVCVDVWARTKATDRTRSPAH